MSYSEKNTKKFVKNRKIGAPYDKKYQRTPKIKKYVTTPPPCPKAPTLGPTCRDF